MKFLRSIKRYFRDAGRSVIRNFSLSLASISCITITLIVVAISIVLSYNVEKMTAHVRSNISIVVFINKDVKEDGLEKIKKQIENTENTSTISFKSKKEYAEETKELDDRFSLIVDSWTDESIPLLDSYEVKVENIEEIKSTAAKIKKIDGVFSVNYGEEYIESVVTIFGIIEKACIGGVIALVLVTAFLIANTIKLAIFSRKTEIEIMRLVGASNIAIKTPFIIEGSFIGFFGAIIPIVLMSYGYISLYNYLDGELFSSSLGKLVEPYPFIIYSSALLLIIGLIVGMIGSKRAVKKYLKI
ncbi:MAG: permease-like cell division protein FtsX [Bacilli bacterium]|nr:permease-like cell division protein FtsX [Bacilli bacterium]